MNEKDIKLLEDWGWEVICESPFEISLMDEEQSQASGAAADIVLEHIKDVDKAIEEIYRVMHVNGFFLVDVPITEKKNYKIEIPN